MGGLVSRTSFGVVVWGRVEGDFSSRAKGEICGMGMVGVTSRPGQGEARFGHALLLQQLLQGVAATPSAEPASPSGSPTNPSALLAAPRHPSCFVA